MKRHKKSREHRTVQMEELHWTTPITKLKGNGNENDNVNEKVPQFFMGKETKLHHKSRTANCARGRGTCAPIVAVFRRIRWRELARLQSSSAVLESGMPKHINSKTTSSHMCATI